MVLFADMFIVVQTCATVGWLGLLGAVTLFLVLFLVHINQPTRSPTEQYGNCYM